MPCESQTSVRQRQTISKLTLMRSSSQQFCLSLSVIAFDMNWTHVQFLSAVIWWKWRHELNAP